MHKLKETFEPETTIIVLQQCSRLLSAAVGCIDSFCSCVALRYPCELYCRYMSLHREPTRREHALGIALSITVAFIWVLSSETISYVFGETNFQKPFLFTYITTSLFSVLALGFLRPSWRAKFDIPSIRAQHYTSVAEGTPRDRTQIPDADATFNVRDVARVSAIIAPLYFIANWAFNAGLGLTSVSSSSTFSNLSPLFTLLICRVLSVEKFTWVKLLASVITLTGALIISGVDRKSGHLTGDLLSIFAAFLFGLYTTTLKMSVPNSRAIDLGMMLSFVGLFTTFISWPLIPLLHVYGLERFQLPSKHVAGILVLNALIGSVLSDFLWAKSVVLTSALVGTIALSLTVPLSLIFDVLFKNMQITPMYIFGVVCVLAGFIIVNIELATKKKTEEEGDGESETMDALQKNASISDVEEEILEF